ncbi:hypothetical protein IMX26_10520 [Clostridium sp. 'deep sea']|uniref:hypothetical protein n=1 Tax=Clostridium sp. 'deep sea' TaxID=2779445 RepID=UPI0018966C91|nr:hypothetical protein [Clostridium sp. 'deep sea']QOR33925.1 hypothetical protein IMX26_10520 [Clostridium sp. 'deep sea']
MSRNFVSKTNWEMNDVVTEHDLNRIEQGIADSYVHTDTMVTGSLTVDNSLKLTKENRDNNSSGVIINNTQDTMQQRLILKDSNVEGEVGLCMDYTTDNGSTWNPILDVTKDKIEWNGGLLSLDRLKFEVTETDSNENPITVEYKRKDNTLYLRKTASNPDDNGFYQTITEQYFRVDGVSIRRIIKFNLKYNSKGLIISSDGGVEINE